LVNHVIEQYTIATTPKYNFPRPTIDTTLPRRFIELSLHSLQHVQNQPIQPNQQTGQQANNIEIMNSAYFRPQSIALRPRREPCIVAAVDTSSIKIGETPTGMLVAVRGANVWKENKDYRYSRLGPFIFHITEENKRDVYTMLQRAYFGSSYDGSHMNFPNIMQMPMRIAGLLERWLQTMLSKSVSKGLILFDGSLTSGTGDTSIQLMKEILATARKKENVVLAFSKMTSLRLNGRLITDVLPKIRPPYLLEMSGVRTKPPILLLGDIYVARFSKEKYAFRLDIDRETPYHQQLAAAERLLWNESLSQSYPETLRLAHILCTFTANEVIAMQHFAVRRYGHQIINRPDMHRVLFGPFGKGEIYS